MKPKEVTGSHGGLCYIDIKKDTHGFVDINDVLPMPYDLVTLKIFRKRAKKNVPSLSYFDKYATQTNLYANYETIYIKGWWTGNEWDGYKLKKTDKILAWRKAQTDYEIGD